MSFSGSKRKGPEDGSLVASSSEGPPPAKKQATLMWGKPKTDPSASASLSAPLAASSLTSATPAAPAGVATLPHPLAKHWANFPVRGPCGNGLGLVPTPACFIPLPSESSAPGAFTLQPGVWYGTRTDPLLSRASFIELSGRRVDEGPSSSSAAAMGSWEATAVSVGAGGAQSAALDLPPGNDRSMAATRAQRAAAFACLSPASLGECQFAYFEPADYPVGAAPFSPAPSAAASSSAGGPSSSSGAGPAGVRVAGFDLDGTLIKPAAPSAKFCSRADDWLPAFGGCLNRVAGLVTAGGYELMLFTNQAGVAKGHTTLPVVLARCAAVASALGVPVTVLVAPGDADFYRKPLPGMWWLYESVVWPAVQRLRAGRAGLAPAPLQQQLRPIDRGASVYIGDAAGRPKPEKTSPSPRKGRDHSAGDLAFALACGLRFATAEAVLGGSLDGVDRDPLGRNPAALGTWVPCRDLPTPSIALLPAGGGASTAGGPMLDPTVRAAAVPACGAAREIVLLVGPPGSGKSTLAAHAFALAGAVDVSAPMPDGTAGWSAASSISSSAPSRRRYVRVNQDLVGSRDKAVAMATDALRRGYDVIVDATNVDAATRKVWVELAARLSTAGAGSGSSSSGGGGGGKAAPVLVRAITLEGSRELSLHLNALRVLSPLGGVDGPDDRRKVPSMVIYSLFNRLEAPSADDASSSRGLARVDSLPLVPGPFAVSEAALRQLEAGDTDASSSSSSSAAAAAAGAPEQVPAPVPAPAGDEGAADATCKHCGGHCSATAPAAFAPQSPTVSAARLLAAVEHRPAPARLTGEAVCLFAEALALQLAYACLGT